MRMPFAVSRIRPPCKSAVMVCIPPRSACEYPTAFRRCGYFASVIHDLRNHAAAPGHRLDRYAPVIVLVHNAFFPVIAPAELTRGFVLVTLEAMSHPSTEPALTIEPSIDERQARCRYRDGRARHRHLRR